MIEQLQNAAWITHSAWAQEEPPFRAPVLRACWTIGEGIVRARVVVAAVGVWTAHLRGAAVSDDVLEPGLSEFRRRVATVEYDVTRLVTPGANEFVLELGEGPAHVREVAGRYTKFADRRVAPRARVALIAEYEEGAGRKATELVLSDASWQAMLGPSTFTHWYGGEDYDSRLEPEGWLTADGTDDAVWEQAVVVPDGPEPWERQSPPVVVVETIEPARSVGGDGTIRYDAGRNLAGLPVLHVGDSVPSGTVIEVWPAEYLDDRGVVDQSTTGTPIFDRFIASGRSAVFRPRFGYHGFRHLEVRAWTSDRTRIDAAGLDLRLEVDRIQTGDESVGAFEVSDPVLSGVYDLVTHAAESNLVGVPTDCPHREKLGWLEQDHLVFGPLAFRWDIRDHFADLVTHMSDAQTDAGLIPDIAPELVVFDFLDEPGYRDDVNWGSAIWEVPFQLFLAYGDLETARRARPSGRRYIDYISGLAGEGLLDHGLSDWIGLDLTVPRALVASYGFRHMLISAARLEAELGDAGQASVYSRRAEELGRMLREAFVSRDADGTLRLGSESQASIALLADAGVLTAEEHAEAVEALVARVGVDGMRLTVGEIALPSFVRVLAAAGHHELLYRLTTTTDAPGYGRMLADGETALCEHWTGRATNGSGNHFMLGYISEWLTGSVAGLTQASESVAWERARFQPAFVEAVDHAAAAHRTDRGEFRITWRRNGQDAVNVEIVVPEGAAGEFVESTDRVVALGSGIHHLTMTRVAGNPDSWRRA